MPRSLRLQLIVFTTSLLIFTIILIAMTQPLIRERLSGDAVIFIWILRDILAIGVGLSWFFLTLAVSWLVARHIGTIISYVFSSLPPGVRPVFLKVLAKNIGAIVLLCIAVLANSLIFELISPLKMGTTIAPELGVRAAKAMSYLREPAWYILAAFSFVFGLFGLIPIAFPIPIPIELELDFGEVEVDPPHWIWWLLGLIGIAGFIFLLGPSPNAS